jgi:hypothetical protein
MKREARAEFRLTVRRYDLLAGVRDVGGLTSMLTRPCPLDLRNDDPQDACAPFDLG